MLKKSIGMALLCMAGQAYSADITVTTTEDIVNDDKECSLREAIEYVNLGLKKEGYMGCGGENSTNNILLTEKKTYVLKNHIEIKASVSIKAVTDVEGTLQEDQRVLGLSNAHIKIEDKDNIFRILSADDAAVLVTLKELDLEGCGEANCAIEGGLIYNKGLLEADYVKFFKGTASKGGAIYSTGRYGSNNQSRFVIKNSLFEQNKASQGGVFYAELPIFAVQQSVIKNNETTQGSSANLYSAPYEDVTNLQNVSAKISNSTLLKNIGSVINVVDGIVLNNLTVVDNSAPALKISAQTEYAYVTNNIILANGNADCELVTNHKAIIQNNVASASCGTGEAVYPNTIWNQMPIFASSNGSEGKCQSLEENKDAILCPFITPANTFLGYLRPRILLKYDQFTDSPIVNQGKSLNLVAGLVACETNDQRLIERLLDNRFCDRGSIEIKVPSAGALVGKNILTGEIAKFSIADKLGDSDLIPKEQCKALVGDHPQGEAWQDGCMKIVQTTTSKGKTTIDIEGNVVYTPNSAWHGADIFELQVITSSTRFNKTKPYLVLNAQIVQEPNDHFEDKSVKTSGGAVGLTALLALFGLLGLRRRLSN